jgi:hypothetical protein
VARQKFSLPLFWQVVNMDMSPRIKDFLVVDAYSRYFTQTIANFEAQYQGRDCRIGKPWNVGEDSDSASPLNVKAMIEMLVTVGNALQQNFGGLPGVMQGLGLTGNDDTRDLTEVDEDGFRHFAGSEQPAQPTRPPNLLNMLSKVQGEAGGFFNDLAEAIQKDLGMPRAKKESSF